jgi:DNA polymerase III delta' subunit
MNFQDIRDQATPIRLLKNLIRRQRIPNGLLFWGAAGVGKRLSAIALAKAINCKEEPEDSCGTCLSCRKIAHDNHTDVKIIAPSGRSRNIGVDVIDFINDLATYHAFESDWRVIIIEDAERMREPAQNHFLKTLEEPPSDTVFILLTEYPGMLLPTIRSRCQQVRFSALRPETVTDLLIAEHDIDPTKAEALADVSQGQMTRALDLLHSEKRDVVLDITRRLASGEDPLELSEEFTRHLTAQRDALKTAIKGEFESPNAKEVSREDREALESEQTAFVESVIRREQMEYLYLLQTWYRDAMIFEETGDAARIMNRDQIDHFKASSGAHRDRLGAIEKAWLYIERNLNIDRVFRDLFFTLAP